MIEAIRLCHLYDVKFYDLYESPPKVSVKISTSTAGFIVGRDTANEDGTDDGVTSLDVVNSIDLIVEFDSVKRKCDELGINCEDEETIAEYCDYYG